MRDIPASLVRCEWHHWISTHQPDFPVYWIRQCSQCGYYDPVDMAEQIAKHATTPEQASLKTERDEALALVTDLQTGLVCALIERNERDATIERVRALAVTIHLLAVKAAEDADAGYRGAGGYADAYQNAERLVRAAIEDPA